MSDTKEPNEPAAKFGKVGVFIAIAGAIAGLTPFLTEIRAWLNEFDTSRSAPIYRSYAAKYKTGFDCTLASKNHEKIICTHKLAAYADVKLNAAFSSVLENTPMDQQKNLRYLQGQWATKVRPSLCPDKPFGKLLNNEHDNIGKCLAAASDTRRTALYEGLLIQTNAPKAMTTGN